MIRRELVRLIVLNSICDGYHNVDQCILSDAAKEGAACGLTIERPEVVETLASLIEDGLAEACLLSPTEPGQDIQGMPQLDVVEEFFETYFSHAEGNESSPLPRRTMAALRRSGRFLDLNCVKKRGAHRFLTKAF